MRKKRDSLVAFLECQFGLMDNLISNDVISHNEAEDINELKGINQSFKLIDFMIKVSKPTSHKAFQDALIRTYQSHLAKYIGHEGGKKCRDYLLNSCAYNVKIYTANI